VHLFVSEQYMVCKTLPDYGRQSKTAIFMANIKYDLSALFLFFQTLFLHSLRTVLIASFVYATINNKWSN